MNALRNTSLAVLAAISFATTSQAKEINLQDAMVDQCVAEMQHFKIADKTTAKKLCTCTTKVQADNLMLGEFWQMQSYAMNGKSPHQLAAVKRIKPMIEKCRAGLKLNKPQVPAKK